MSILNRLEKMKQIHHIIEDGECPICHGRGWYLNHKCRRCKGTGKVASDAELKK